MLGKCSDARGTVVLAMLDEFSRAQYDDRGERIADLVEGVRSRHAHRTTDIVRKANVIGFARVESIKLDGREFELRLDLLLQVAR
jgi:hypothetical protein